MQAFGGRVTGREVVQGELCVGRNFLRRGCSPESAFEDFLATVLKPLWGSGTVWKRTKEVLLESLGGAIVGIFDSVDGAFDGEFKKIDGRASVEGQPVPRLNIVLGRFGHAFY